MNVDLAFIVILACSTVGVLVSLYVVDKIAKMIKVKA